MTFVAQRSPGGQILVLAPKLSEHLTKFQSLGVKKDVKISLSNEIPEITVDSMREYSGVLLIAGFTYDNFKDSALPPIRSYVNKGGKVFVLTHPEITEHNTALIENFGLSVARELMHGEKSPKGQASIDGSSICPLFKGKIGSAIADDYGPYMGSYFTFKDPAQEILIRSKENQKDRPIAGRLKIGKGQIWFVTDFTMSVHQPGGFWTYSAYSSILLDKRIDLFDNEQAALAIIEWLSH